MVKKPTKGYLSVSKEDKDNYYTSNAYLADSILLNQAFKGEVTDKVVSFPKGLGAAHPFDFNLVENTYKQIGLVNGAVNAYTDAIMGDFTVTVQEPNAQAAIDSFIKDSNFAVVLRSWINEAVLKGNGFLELDLKESKVRVMNANNMYVVRSKKGKTLRYNQYKGKSDEFIYTKDKNNLIPFEKNQIAHLQLNKIPNDPYGIGYLWPSIVSVNNYASAELDQHKLMSRKAGAPIHVTVGAEGEAVDPAAVDAFKESLQYMNNRTEWVTDGNTKMTTIDFQGVGDNLFELSNHDIEQVAFGMGIPMVMLGKADIPEGLAKAQKDKFQKTINSIRTVIEKVAEEFIFRPLLNNQSPERDMSVDFQWELPSQEEIEIKLKNINETLKNPFISPALKASLEKEYAVVAELEDLDGILLEPKDAMKKAEEEEKEEKDMLRKQEEEIKQPEVPGAKPTAKESAQNNIKESKNADLVVKPTAQNEKCDCQLTEAKAREMNLAQYVNITEIAGFNYSDYLIKILQKLKTWEFKELVAGNMEEVSLGLLPQKDIEKLRIILKNGFRKNQTIREIERNIMNSIALKDRLTLNEDGTTRLALSKDARAIAIARTETVRLANQGLKDLYMENNIKKYRYLAALDDRTSEICASLNGRVFDTADGQPGVNMPAMHTNCRSTIVGLVD